MSLLSDPVKENKIRLLDVETYEETFGPKSRRKKIKLQVNSLEEMAEKVEEKTQTYEPEKDRDIKRERNSTRRTKIEIKEWLLGRVRGSGKSFTKSSTRLMCLFRFWMLAIPKGPDQRS